MYDQCFDQGKFVRKHLRLDGQSYYLSMRPNPNSNAKVGEEVLIFLTLTRPIRKTVDQYVKRWRIECLFLHLKTNGFNLEDLNLKSPRKSQLMMAVLALAYAITVRAAWNSQSSIRRISYADGSVFPAPSIFRRGLALVSAWCASVERFITYLLVRFDTANHAICKKMSSSMTPYTFLAVRVYFSNI